MRQIILSSMLFVLLVGTAVDARVVGRAGVVYPILEKDAITEIEEAAKKKDWAKVFDEAADKARDVFGKAGEELFVPRSPEPSKRIIDMTYILPFDVPDPANIRQTLYPAGMTFNPLEYSRMYETWVFFDASDSAQVEWFAKTYKTVGSEVPILTGGSAVVMEKRFKRAFYVATKGMMERLKVRYVPCTAKQEGTAMIMEEMYVAN